MQEFGYAMTKKRDIHPDERKMSLMELIQRTYQSFLQVAEKILDVLEGEFNFRELEEKLKQETNNLGKDILRMALEAADEQIKHSFKQRKGWIVERKADRKTLLTPFGEVTYERTYYKHKDTGQYAYLVDEAAGISPHTKVDALVKADAVELAVELSYRKSGNELQRQNSAVMLSGQAVMDAIREIDTQQICPLPKGSKRTVRVLYIEADEDHVASFKRRGLMPKLVYVHEGYLPGSEKRPKLKNCYYFSGMYKDSEQLWFEVLNYIYSQYHEDGIERIFVSGDGASWIRQGAEYIPKGIFVLDRYHISKYITAATPANEMLRSQMWQAVNGCDKAKLNRALTLAKQSAASKSAQKAVRDCKIYLSRNWEGITAYKRYEGQVIGCSAEGHVSHILSARMSSRPCAWGLVGADQMARLRAAKANGVRLRDAILSQEINAGNLLKICTDTIKRERIKLKQPMLEDLDNLPSLNGKRTPIAQILRALKHIA